MDTSVPSKVGIRQDVDAGRAEHQELSAKAAAENPEADAESLAPLEVRADKIDTPLTWLVLDVVDPLNGFDHSPTEKNLFWVFAFLHEASRQLEAFYTRRQEKDPISPMLVSQLDAVVRKAKGQIHLLVALFYHGFQRAAIREQALQRGREA